MSTLPTTSGAYFEDFELGQKGMTAGRTIAEADITAFAGLSGDFNAIHTDAEFAKNTPFGQRVAHGLLTLSIASGLAVQTGILGANVIAFREVKEWKFIKPVFIGDTIKVELEVVELKHLPRLHAGTVVLSASVLNQDNEITMKGYWTVLAKTKI
ncbi:MAG TPA: MaoC/PaaZ C-terminal domain-containing protein [Anaerolineales bacterium]|nr:MaoC/PaaZ C-terminal domain-containing protein [Anaerolineales bacterium]